MGVEASARVGTCGAADGVVKTGGLEIRVCAARSNSSFQNGERGTVLCSY